MMMARAEKAELLLCGRGTVKTAVLKAEEGILKTAMELQAQVQVRCSSHHPKVHECTQAWNCPNSKSMNS
jgi:hypothetical protein